MRVLRSIEALAEIHGPVVVAAGVFDGLHLGHRAVLETARREAASIGATPVPLTFDPHPATVLRPDRIPRLLTPTPFKLRLFERMGFEHALVVGFDRQFADTPAEEFVSRLCASARPLAGICIGEGWTFGRQRGGNIGLLRSLGGEKKFFTREVAPVRMDGMVVSSTMVRLAVAEGRLADAAKFLDRDHAIAGPVEHGAGLGRKIGIPTANLSTEDLELPPDGVYAVETVLDREILPGVANLGVRPTVSETPRRLLEVHLLDFQGDLYGRDIEVRLRKFLRHERKFASLEELRARIALDLEDAREFLANPEAAA